MKTRVHELRERSCGRMGRDTRNGNESVVRGPHSLFNLCPHVLHAFNLVFVGATGAHLSLQHVTGLTHSSQRFSAHMFLVRHPVLQTRTHCISCGQATCPILALPIPSLLLQLATSLSHVASASEKSKGKHWKRFPRLSDRRLDGRKRQKEGRLLNQGDMDDARTGCRFSC